LQVKDRENYAPRPGIAIEASSSELIMQNLKHTAWPKRVSAENEVLDTMKLIMSAQRATLHCN